MRPTFYLEDSYRYASKFCTGMNSARGFLGYLSFLGAAAGSPYIVYRLPVCNARIYILYIYIYIYICIICVPMCNCNNKFII